MAVSLKTAGTWQEATANATVTLVGSPAVGDRYYIFASWKDFSVTAQIAGWTEVTEFADGSVTAGNGTGSMKVACWYKDWQSGDANPTLSFSSNPNIASYVCMLWQKASTEFWNAPTFVTAAWPATSTTQTVNASSTTTVPSGAVVMALVGLRDDSATFTRSTTAIAATSGITWNGNYVESPAAHVSTTTGFDMAADLGHRFVTTGGSGITLQVSATISATETGACLWIIQTATTGAGGGINATLQAVTASLAGEARFPKTEELVDPFDTKDTVKWTWDAGADASGGRAVLQPGGVNTQIQTPKSYDFSSSYLVFEISQMLVTGEQALWGFYNSLNGGDAVRFYKWIDGNLYFTEVVNSVQNDSGMIAWDSTAHRYTRLWESGGTLYWDTSPDGVSWTNRRSKTWAIGQIGQVLPFILIGTGSGQPLWVEGVNILPVAAPSLVTPARKPNYGSLLQL